MGEAWRRVRRHAEKRARNWLFIDILGQTVDIIGNMFKEILRKIIGKMNGEAIGTILMDKEGITVDKIVEDDSLDIETAGMEYSVVLKDIFKAAEMMKAGEVNEVLIRTGRFAAIMRVLDETYFVALFLKSSGSVGRGRYVLRTVSPELKKEL